jgi:hypothetical protein
MITNVKVRTTQNAFARTYFNAFYNTNFPINCIISLSLLLPLLIVESLSNHFGVEELASQLSIAIYSAFLYGVVYAINDLADYTQDLERKIFKSSLLSRTGSRLRVVSFLLWVLLTLLIVSIEFPKAGRLFCYSLILLGLLAVLHSYWPKVKPVTLFLERGVRYTVPPLFLYLIWPRALTAGFLLSSVLIYPIVMDAPYLDYLKLKRGWKTNARKWSLFLYLFYYACVAGWVSLRRSTYAHQETVLRVHAPLGVISCVAAPILLFTYWLYNKAANLGSHFLPRRLATGGNPIHSEERRRLICLGLLTVVFISLTALYVNEK